MGFGECISIVIVRVITWDVYLSVDKFHRTVILIRGFVLNVIDEPSYFVQIAFIISLIFKMDC